MYMTVKLLKRSDNSEGSRSAKVEKKQSVAYHQGSVYWQSLYISDPGVTSRPSSAARQREDFVTPKIPQPKHFIGSKHCISRFTGCAVAIFGSEHLTTPAEKAS